MARRTNFQTAPGPAFRSTPGSCGAPRQGLGQKKHATVDYVFTHSPYKLYQFHLLVMAEMQARGYHPDAKWFDSTYRGLHCPAYLVLAPCPLTDPIYPEHDQQYLAECLENLRSKGIQILI